MFLLIKVIEALLSHFSFNVVTWGDVAQGSGQCRRRRRRPLESR